MEPFSLPSTLLLGAASSAFQIEGGDTGHSWHRWSLEPGRIRDGSNCSAACDHWNRVAEDTSLMKKLGLQTCRLGIEWSRVEPAEGRFDESAIAHYRDEISRMRKAGIVPLVTLHHFSNPLWMEDSGSWLDYSAADRFERYVRRVVRDLGDLVADWVTINEPNVYLYQSFVEGSFPPGTHSIRSYLKGARVMIRAHIRAYAAIHGLRRGMGFDDTMVGVAHHLRLFDPLRGTFMERKLSGLLNRLFQDIFLVGMASGRHLLPVGAGHPSGRGNFQDFIGINYYSRDMISARPGKNLRVREGAPVNDLGWEIYPEGLYRVCRDAYWRFRKPVYITENGTCDFGDAFRARYIIDHLRQVKRLLNDGVDVRRYYHWSFMDNFELAEGLRYRFGLVHVDFDTQKRTIKKSGKLYAEIIAKRVVTKKMIAAHSDEY
ncbi:MAG TPA: glycoside hydrolase family 1 protein [Spirochaetota bacterium]|nr:glycoside hydrolase family 1 protein [Spirochaetota bacterium]